MRSSNGFAMGPYEESLEKDALLKAARTLSSYGSIAKPLDDRMVISSP